MNEGDFDRSDRKRCCKIRGAVACNVLLIAHMFLTVTEGIMALVYQSPSLYSYKLNTAYWALFGVNYGILVVAFLPCAHAIDAFNIHTHLGHIHACNAFEFVNFIVFWVSLILAVTSKVFRYEIQIFYRVVLGTWDQDRPSLPFYWVTFQCSLELDVILHSLNLIRKSCPRKRLCSLSARSSGDALYPVGHESWRSPSKK